MGKTGEGVIMTDMSIAQQVRPVNLADTYIGDIGGEVTLSENTDEVYIGDIKFGEELPAGTQIIGHVESAISSGVMYNVTCTNVNTEYSQALPANCRGFEMQCRTPYAVRFSLETGKVATPTAPYATLKVGMTYESPVMAQGESPSTVYVASATAGVVVEIIAWT